MGERAALFLQALRVDEGAIEALMLNLGASRVQAIAALRRCGGSPDKAADALLSGATEREAAKRRREKQRKLGQCADGAFVDPERLTQMTNMGIEKELALAALKHANNDVSSALDAVQTQPRDVLLNRGSKAKKAKTDESSQKAAVDEIALVSLMSMGFEKEQAENALRNTGDNVEEALMYITSSASSCMQEASKAASIQEEDGEHDDLAEALKLSVELSTNQESAAGDAEQEKNKAEQEEAERALAVETQAELDAKRKAEEERAAEEKAALDAAREVVERELGQCLKREDMDDELAGASLEDEEILVQQHLSSL